jgi:hypothetical protein
MDRTIIGVDGGLLWWVVVIGLFVMNFFIAVIEQTQNWNFFEAYDWFFNLKISRKNEGKFLFLRKFPKNLKSLSNVLTS